MQGITGHRLVHKGTSGSDLANAGLINVAFPNKTTVESQQLIDTFGRPTYRKDIKV